MRDPIYRYGNELDPVLDQLVVPGGGAPGKVPTTARLMRAPVIIYASGVQVGAEAEVERAASSSGAPLPAPIQRKFEASVGADLSGVRVHTGPASQAAAAAVGAQAYTVGQDVHFGAGKYQPDDPFGLHLLAHEVAHTVQQAGGTPHRQHKLEVSSPHDAAEHEADRAADAMVRGEPVAIGGLAPAALSRAPCHDGDEGSLPPDMEPFDWTGMVEDTTGPEAPSPIAIAVPGATPILEGMSHDPTVPRDGCEPSHHGGDDSGFGHLLAPPQPRYPFHLFEMRNRAWSAYRETVASTVGIYNGAAPLIAKFAEAEKDPALAALYELQQDPSQPGNLHQLANRQVVPRTNSSGLTVGDMFATITNDDGSKLSFGREADTSGLDDNIAQASKSEEVESKITNLKAKDAALQGTLDELGAAEKEASAAGHALAATEFAVSKEKAESDKENAEDDLARAKAKADQIKGYVTGALGLITSVATVLGAAGEAKAGGTVTFGGQQGTYTPYAPPGGIAGAQPVADIAGSSVVASIAEQIIGLAFSHEIGVAETKIAAAVQAYRQARKGEAKESWLAAADQFAANAKKLAAKLNFLKEKLSERKNAYLELAAAAAKAGGGSQQEQDRMKALIMAIPVARAVVAQTSTIMGMLREPRDSYASQVGFRMAVHAGDGSPLELLHYAGQLRGYIRRFGDVHAMWSARVQSLEGVIGRLSGG